MTASRVVSTGTSCLKRSAGVDGTLGNGDNPPEKPDKLDKTKHHYPKVVSAYQSPARGKIGSGNRTLLHLTTRKESTTLQRKISPCLNMKLTRCLSTAWMTPAPPLLLRISGKCQTATLTTSPMRKTGHRSAPRHYGKAHTH